MDADKVALLKNMPVFGAVSDDALEFIVARCRDVSRDADEFFFRETDSATAMYVIQSGRVAVVREHAGHQYRLAELSAGDCFGEMALIECAARSAAVAALEPCDTLEMGLDVLHALYEHDIEQFVLIQMNLGREMSRRLRAAADQIFEARVAASELGGDYRWYLL